MLYWLRLIFHLLLFLLHEAHDFGKVQTHEVLRLVVGEIAFAVEVNMLPTNDGAVFD